MQEAADYLGDFSIWEGHAAAAAEKIRAVLVVPINLHGRTVGLLWVARRSVGQLGERAKARLQALAASAAIALENARLYKEIAEKNTELELANTTLADSIRVKTEFLANISHEIKTPIGSTLGLLKLILDGLCANPEEQRAFIEQAHASARHLLRLVNDLLDMSQVESGKFRMELEPVDLGRLFQELRAIVQVQANAKGLTLAFYPPDPAHAVIQADHKRLMQVLLNLVTNSLKFTEQGSIIVRGTARPDKGFMTIEVADTGIGISLERQPHLFQKFVQADGSTTRKYGGTGLGLAISKHFVEMMGGVITLERRGEGCGTTVTVALPLSRDSAPGQPEEERPGPGAVQGPSEAPLILVVEDSSDLRDLLRDFLNESGFQTALAATADEALSLASRLHPAVLLVDLALSSSESASLRTGVDLVAAMSRKPELREVPVVLLTGALTEARALLRNVELSIPLPIVEKPVDFSRLLSTIEMVLTHHGSEPADEGSPADDPAVTNRS
ncbi:MAG: ATP-binding protein, partial [Anaerolineae bacterium]